ncbi:MAG TPA: dolichyl-phosphate beta-glucosyltransferase [Blastocatellia bacterium]|nr:dolichyl-phosphate beta-glucosyltransferase [Blastocatellia bacterium]
MTPDLSIVIPAYNEEARIGRSLDSILDFVSQRAFSAEVVVVDDGSSDDTAAVVAGRTERYLAAGVRLRTVTNKPNRGKGYSVRRGVLEARGAIVLFTDADLSSPITESPKLIDPIVENRADVTFGSRALDRSLVGVHQPLIRDFGGRIFNLLMKIITGLPFQDTQCGFKAFRRQPALPVFNLQRIEGFGFDPELLYVSRKHGLKLLEVPVTWNDVAGSRVNYFTDSLRMFGDLILIRLNDLMSRYSAKAPASAQTVPASVQRAPASVTSSIEPDTISVAGLSTDNVATSLKSQAAAHGGSRVESDDQA